MLFADLKGSMELLADRDPEEARKLLDPVLERMMEAVHRYEGTVNQVMGDGIMALFGAPLAHEDHAVRACYAALRMQESVKRYAEEVRRSHGVPVQIRVGLNSGEVVVRAIGSRSAHGLHGGRARRRTWPRAWSSWPTPGTDPADARHAGPGRGLRRGRRRSGPMPVKGLADPIEVFELIGASARRGRGCRPPRPAGSRGSSAATPSSSSSAGRWSRAGAGHGQVVAIVGEPGVGKSRLVWEFTHSHRTQGLAGPGGGSVSYGKATSYLPVIDLLKSYFGIERPGRRRARCARR